ncbi:hypothetical protein [Mesorhizobium temperatum]|uniref:Uncharacterized protein n=1 Tax=Mesorhizobium temperatum TaxID=241416 RepID=A0A271LUD1_9HYPH|nr:hypothetical protein [Mesorhizobium temperatum]PAQ11723.1 hypothetical protein CIT26_03405 [Mesorhizobium temperatum]
MPEGAYAWPHLAVQFSIAWIVATLFGIVGGSLDITLRYGQVAPKSERVDTAKIAAVGQSFESWPG